MYTRINWITWWLLNIVTCGIYGIYIWYKMTKDLNDMAEKVDEKPVMGYILQLLLGCVTCGIYSIVWMFQFLGSTISFSQDFSLYQLLGVFFFFFLYNNSKKFFFLIM